ncbi:MAG: tryptophan synthase subunit alpha [Armatimonadota bacterium]|nr:tryptophan synthase subunit alpha [bacterium]
MNRIDAAFAELKSHGEKALICFLTCGDPNFPATKELVLKTFESGADIMELGVPFSDPLADGPTIQSASFRALQAGATVHGVIETVRSIRQECDKPIVLMTYFNPIQRYGLSRFAKDSSQAGADGVIMVDLPAEEAAEWKSAADGFGLATIFLLAPTSTKERIALTAKMASGFIYCVSRTGVTGAQSSVPADLKSLVDTIKAASGLPVAIGFGISKPEHVREVTQFADGAVVGSALVNMVADKADVGHVGEFVKELKAGTRQ